MMSFRKIAQKMDPLKPAQTLAGLINMHRWLPSDTQSLGGVTGRHESSSTRIIRFLTMNTYLMDAWPFDEAIKPAAKDRAKHFSTFLKPRHDVMLLQEIWEDSILDLVRSGWSPEEAISFDEDSRTNTGDSSGLVTASQIETFRRLGFHKYDETSGNDSHSSKGVLASIIDPGFGESKLELYNTHLQSGGDRGQIRARAKQIHELSKFYRRTHNPANLAIIAGDFNVDGDSSQYTGLSTQLSNLGLRDVWKLRNGTPGYTELRDVGLEQEHIFKAIHQKICQPAADDPLLCDDEIPADHISKRLDYIFINDPHESHTFRLDFTRPRRTRYERRANAPERNIIDFISDHLGISCDLILSRV